jgi:hypothetical protein
LTHSFGAGYFAGAPSTGTMRRISLLVVSHIALAGVGVGLLGAYASRPAWAAAVRGSVTLPSELKSGRRLRGHWRIENGIVPLGPPANRGDTVVVLTGVKGTPPPARTVTVEISGYLPQPATVVVGEGSVVELKNNDRVPHDLSIPEVSSLMPMERLAPGALRRQKFLTAGGYTIRDAEYPHMAISVLVVGSPFHAVVDDKGGFKLPDAPDGRATLKVWSQGRWVHEQEIEVGPKSADLAIKVEERAGKPDKSPDKGSE